MRKRSFSDLYVFSRASSSLLNGGLLPVIGSFLRAVNQVFKARGLTVPRVTVRSDGTLMSEAMTAKRPVDTLLSGPAASVRGGLALSGRQTCVLVDMGGTTTDTALAEDGEPLHSSGGIRVGRWQTAVSGLRIDTIALGGDSGVRVVNGSPMLLKRRLVPLCVLSSHFPDTKARLSSILRDVPQHTLPLHEAFILERDIRDDDARYDASEHALIKALHGGPLFLTEAADATGIDKYMLRPVRLEREEIIQRAGLTPTDVMHVLGDFTAFDKEAPVPALDFLARCTLMEQEKLEHKIYGLVKEKLYCSLVRLLLEYRQPGIRANGMPEELNHLIVRSWKAYVSGRQAHFLQPQFSCNSPLVGLGAPIHLFLPDVAEALGTECVIPEWASVANAAGAICGCVRAEVTLEVRSRTGVNKEEVFYIVGHPESGTFEGLESADSAGRDLAEKLVRREASERGAQGSISVTCTGDKNLLPIAGSLMFMELTIHAAAVGAVRPAAGQ